MDAVVPGDWPPIKHGIWKIDTTRVFPNGKAKRSSRSFSACSDTRYLFMGYWGGGIVEIEGCQYTATRVTGEKFRIVTECIVRGLARPSHAETEVTLRAPDAFELKGTVREKKKTYGVTEIGGRISDCSSGQQP